MNKKLEKLIEELDNRYGNPKAPQQFKTIQLAIKELRRLQELENNLENKL
jgi:hypothetical protein